MTANRAAILFDRNASDATGSQTGVEGVTDSNVPGTFPEGTVTFFTPMDLHKL